MTKIWIWVVGLCMILAACDQGQTTLEPPAIHYGEDVCTECGMIISDPRFASSYLYEINAGHYESLMFDDVGDMMVHAAQHPEHQVRAWYVHDFNSEEWIDATQAHYVIAEEIHTPMGHGIAAFAIKSAAESLAAQTQGKVFDWAALLQHYGVKVAT